ncbi:MAG: ABC transporter ATP-binding protein [Methylocystis sp.]|jgi:NitT/TauT family transport system ATP-binding protein|nr:ABC transporter ATP-binding protein [Methylocystis sp.]MCA3584808.1 ABC transporter ATP-binding protein [Methylocystis sp.]MCA3587507.1 ABC transporter ATP-binding protein [Methylocystis sp.]MCA3593003.1 ABC transporter ATP-binding protein [Methylocystis sp.]
MSRTLISLVHIRKEFANGTVALDDFSMDVREGEFLSLLGPSGCGKSTALRLIAGLADVSAGAITWPSGGSARSGIGFVFQEPTLMPWASVIDNVYLPLKLKGLSRTEAMPRIMDTLALVGLADFAKVYPRELSGGMKMRVSIARALVTEPKLLLMDEPFAALDEITRFKLNDDILRLKEARNVTVIFVTHSVYESVYLSSRIIVMAARPGRVVAEIAVDAPYPRNEDFRATAIYTETCKAASQALHGAMAAHDHL